MNNCPYYVKYRRQESETISTDKYDSKLFHFEDVAQSTSYYLLKHIEMLNKTIRDMKEDK